VYEAVLSVEVYELHECGSLIENSQVNNFMMPLSVLPNVSVEHTALSGLQSFWIFNEHNVSKLNLFPSSEESLGGTYSVRPISKG
jgi:hypothetical protein